MLGVSHVVTTSVGMCDIDIRPVRFQNIALHSIYMSCVCAVNASDIMLPLFFFDRVCMAVW